MTAQDTEHHAWHGAGQFPDTCTACAREAAPPTVERKGLTIYIDGQPGPTLASPILTRPQDWTPAQAAILWTQAELAHRAQQRA